RRPISMFSYDLVAQHRELWAMGETFRGCNHHLEPTMLPGLEATRLLLNRCTGLLLARTILAESSDPVPLDTTPNSRRFDTNGARDVPARSSHEASKSQKNSPTCRFGPMVLRAGTSRAPRAASGCFRSVLTSE